MLEREEKAKRKGTRVGMSFNETLWVLEGKQICSKPNRMRDNRVQIQDELYNHKV